MIRFFFVFASTFLIFSSPLIAQNQLGIWGMYFGNFKVSERWSIHNEAQYRSFELAPTSEQLLLRAGAQYHFKNKMAATLGYAHIFTWSHPDALIPAKTVEYRIWQQFVMKNKLWLLHFGHRYRIEQRWIYNTISENTSYRNRVRYFLTMDLPLNRKEMTEGTVFFSAYNEFFLDTDNWIFEQNRLFAAMGYKLNDMLTFKAGYLYQYAGGSNFNRLQLGVWFKPDFSKKD